MLKGIMAVAKTLTIVFKIQLLSPLSNTKTFSVYKIPYRYYCVLLQTLQTCQPFKQGDLLSSGKWLDKFYIAFRPVLVLKS